jgi:integrase
MLNQQVENWLSECRSPTTKRLYETRITRFFQWYNGSVEQFLALTPAEKRNAVLRFQNAHLFKKNNSTGSYVTAVLSFLRSVDMPLNLRGKTLRVEMDLTSHTFTNGDLQKMFDVADIKGKALLALATSLGWEVSAVIGLKREYLESMIEKAKAEDQQFYYFLSQRQKTGVPRLGVLNPLALEWLPKWFIESDRYQKRNRKKNPKRDYGNSEVFGVNELSANRIVQRLARRAHIVTTGRVHFHKIRAWVMSNLSRAGFNEFQVKFCVGKAIPATDLTYLETLKQQIEERYPVAYQDYLSLQSTVPAKALIKMSKETESMKLQLEQKDAEMLKLKERVFKLENVSKPALEALLKRLEELEQKAKTKDLL